MRFQTPSCEFGSSKGQMSRQDWTWERLTGGSQGSTEEREQERVDWHAGLAPPKGEGKGGGWGPGQADGRSLAQISPQGVPHPTGVACTGTSPFPYPHAQAPARKLPWLAACPASVCPGVARQGGSGVSVSTVPSTGDASAAFPGCHSLLDT